MLEWMYYCRPLPGVLEDIKIGYCGTMLATQLDVVIERGEIKT